VVAPTIVPREEIPWRKWPFLQNNSFNEKEIKLPQRQKDLKCPKFSKKSTSNKFCANKKFIIPLKNSQM
jgi:hypothetical protein